MIVGEERDQREDRDDLHLHFVRPMSYAFRHRVQLEVEVSYNQNDQDEKHDDRGEQIVGLPGPAMNPGTWSVSAA
ncbi:hypothetical protein N7E02_17455 [Aliirhizobium terrae]|uniref:hypothetical protein n=1 Tax=Terrirhizobium terrae TaxID=2926709 RepID=UPI002576F230|nr:hypothetical protein [Rhizobium sp. CC-CFT758]WJH41995.1 hypothetical protein N7E02_17455 [Rhizobium sp. CC-CFT758]